MSQRPDSDWCQVTSGRLAKAALEVGLGAGFAVPDGDAVAPPELAGDAPVALFGEPVDVALGVAFGGDADLAGGDGVDGLLGEARRAILIVGHADEPLVGEVGLDGGLAAVGEVEAGGVGLGLDEEALGFEVGHDALADLLAWQIGINPGVLVVGAVGVEEVDHREVVAQTGLVVVGVVRGGDLDAAGAELGIDEDRVGEDRDAAAGEGEFDLLADEVLVAGVVGVDGDGGVAEHGFGAGGGDVEGLIRAGDGVLDGPEVALDFFVVDLVVGDGGAELGVPVDEALASENLAGLEEVEEGAADGLRADVVEGEAGAGPVARAAHELELAEDAGFVLVFPGPDAFDEGVSAEVVAVLLFFLEDAALDDSLGGDAGVVGAGHPEGVVTLHPSPAGEDVLKGVVERVAEVEGAGDVGRGDDDGEGGLFTFGMGGEVAAIEPESVPPALGFVRVVLLGEVGDAHAWLGSGRWAEAAVSRRWWAGPTGQKRWWAVATVLQGHQCQTTRVGTKIIAFSLKKRDSSSISTTRPAGTVETVKDPRACRQGRRLSL